MPAIFEIKSRLEGLQGIHNVTYAMQIVTISRLKRINAQLSATRESAQTLRGMMRYLLSEDPSFSRHFIDVTVNVEKPPVIFVFFSNRGFCGSFNQDVVSCHNRHLQESGIDPAKVDLVLVGKHAKNWRKIIRGNVVATFEPERDIYAPADITRVFEVFNQCLQDRRQVEFVYCRFKSIISQDYVAERVFPVPPAAFGRESGLTRGVPFFTEPSFATVKKNVAEMFFQLWLVQAMRESSSSEFSQRFLLMKSAVDNVKQITEDLTLESNKERQRMITQEIAEIIGTFKALSEKR